LEDLHRKMHRLGLQSRGASPPIERAQSKQLEVRDAEARIERLREQQRKAAEDTEMLRWLKHRSECWSP
jgi:hypothetical protein